MKMSVYFIFPKHYSLGRAVAHKYKRNSFIQKPQSLVWFRAWLNILLTVQQQSTLNNSISVRHFKGQSNSISADLIMVWLFFSCLFFLKVCLNSFSFLLIACQAHKTFMAYKHHINVFKVQTRFFFFHWLKWVNDFIFVGWFFFTANVPGLLLSCYFKLNPVVLH